ncbi:MAG: hypothetical protein NVS1B10_02010 [Candidatus Saccharimonadales bacterium]
MSTFKKRINFPESDEGMAIKQELSQMVRDGEYITVSSYNANPLLYPDHDMSFVEKHMHYLSAHQNVNPRQYLSNLRLMTRDRKK